MHLVRMPPHIDLDTCPVTYNIDCDRYDIRCAVASQTCLEIACPLMLCGSNVLSKYCVLTDMLILGTGDPLQNGCLVVEGKTIIFARKGSALDLEDTKRGKCYKSPGPSVSIL